DRHSRSARRDDRGRVASRGGSVALTQTVVDFLAFRAHRRSGLRRPRDREYLTAQRNHVGTHGSTLRDLVLLHVVEEFGSVVIGGFVGGGIRPFLDIRAHVSMMPHEEPGCARAYG